MKRLLVCLSLAWKLVLVMSMEAHGAERVQWTDHRAHELVRPAMKDGPQVSTFSIGIPVDVSKNCFADPKGDVYSGDPSRTVDLTQVCGGTNGSVTEVTMIFSMRNDVFGLVCLDTDRNAETGKRFRVYRTGVKGIGCDYELDLFEVTEYGIVYINDVSGQRIGSFPARMDGNVLIMEIPLSIIKDNGNMNVAMMVGDQWGPTDWLDVPSPAGQSGLAGYSTWLPIFVAETAIYPAGGKFIQGMPFPQVNTYSNAAPGVTVSMVRIFLKEGNSQAKELHEGLPIRNPLPMSIGFGVPLSHSPGRHKFMILMETNAGTFVDEVEFEIIPWPQAAPTRSQPPVPTSSPFPTPPTPPLPSRG
ncbi:MAG: hypothetical protein Q8R34_01770 [bacterium]|nr:hypothetical protein [bacterium]